MPSAKTTPKKPEKPPEPNDVVRETAGNYLSGDARFEVRQSDSNWYLVDREQTNEFGQELIHGPFRSLKAARTAMPGARDIKPLLRSRARTKTPPAKKKDVPAPPPPTWIDKLAAADASEVRKLIRALEKVGIDQADEVVRKDRLATLPFAASELVRHRLDAIVDDLSEDQRDSARRVIQRVVDVLVEEGAQNARPLPRWALLESDPLEGRPARRIRLRS